MPRKREKKKREYRDTFDFRLFPDYTYTAAQRKRFLLFQGRIEHWKAAVNYADSFDDPNRINILFLIGYSNKIRAYVEKTKANLVVLCADVPSEFLKAYDDYWALVKSYQGSGYANQEDGFMPQYFTEREKENSFRESGLLADDIFLRNDREAAIIGAYEIAKRDADFLFSKWIVVSKLLPEQRISQSDLGKVVKKIYPFGREQAGVGDGAYTAAAKRLREAIRAGLSRSDCTKLLHLQNSDSYEVCKKSIRRCEMDLNVALRKTGYANLTQIMERMKHPPYGWSSEVHAAYCFGYALSIHLENTWVWDEVTCFPTSEVIETIVLHTVQGLTLRKKGYVLIEEAGYSLSERFAYLFDIGSDQYVPKDDTDKEILSLHCIGMSERKIAQKIGTMSNVAVHKRLSKMKQNQDTKIPMCNMASLICKKIENMSRWPVSLVDQRLRDTLCGDFNQDVYLSIPIFGRQKVRDELAYFTWDRCKELKEKLLNINEYVPGLIRQRYGNDVDIDHIYNVCTTQCSGWLWDADFFWEHIDRSIK